MQFNMRKTKLKKFLTSAFIFFYALTPCNVAFAEQQAAEEKKETKTVEKTVTEEAISVVRMPVTLGETVAGNIPAAYAAPAPRSLAEGLSGIAGISMKNYGRITGLGDGVDPNDAVNVGQMNKALANKTDSGFVNAAGAVAVGKGSTASGASAIAAGNGSKAEKGYASAYGVNSQASGDSSTALGANTNASGSSSSAIGSGAIASGTFSTAIASGSNANAKYSVAIGSNSVVSGDNSVAIGNYGSASGASAVAIGNSTKAWKLNSVAIGTNAEAKNETSLALGYSAIAEGKDSIALGSHSVAVGEKVLSIGDTKDPSHLFTRRITGVAEGVDDYDAVNVAQLNSVSNVLTGKADKSDLDKGLAEKLESGASSGEGAVAAGKGATASGASAIAAGNGSKAEKGYASAYGVNSHASGDSSTALGANTNASGSSSSAIGSGANASGYFSTAIAPGANANAKHSVAIGSNSVVSGDNSVVIGNSGSASGVSAVVIGPSAKASGLNSAAIGASAEAKNETSLAMGYAAIAEGKDSVALGAHSFAAGERVISVGDTRDPSHLFTRRITGVAEGVDDYDAVNVSQFNKTKSLAEDNKSKLDNFDSRINSNTSRINSHQDKIDEFSTKITKNKTDIDSIKESINGITDQGNNVNSEISSIKNNISGINTALGNKIDMGISSGISSLALGKGSVVSGDNAVAAGNGSKAENGYASAYGVNSNASGVSSTALGAYSGAYGSYSSAIGSGAKAGGDYSVAIAPNAKSEGVYSLAIGFDSSADRDNSVAIGNGAKNGGSFSSVIGASSVVSGDYSTVAGVSNKVEGNNSILIGNTSGVKGNFSTLIGSSASVDGDNSVAIGINSVVNGENSTALGNASEIKGISSVAVGTSSNVNSDYSTAVGSHSKTGGKKSTALGYRAVAEGKNSIAIGSYSFAGDEVSADQYVPYVPGNTDESGRIAATVKGDRGVVSVGDPENKNGEGAFTRRITGVRAGEDDTDAVNIAQLKAVETSVNQKSDSLDKMSVKYSDLNYDRVFLGVQGAPVALTNIKAGVISEHSSDAINGAQLYKLANDIADAINIDGEYGTSGFVAKVNLDGTPMSIQDAITTLDAFDDALTANGGSVNAAKLESLGSGVASALGGSSAYTGGALSTKLTVNGTEYHSLQDALTALEKSDGTIIQNSTGGWDLEVNGEKQHVGNAGKVSLASGKNMEIKKNDNGSLEFAVSQNPEFESVKVGDIKIDNSGINLGGKGTVSGLADGGIYQGSSDAVTGNQMWNAYQRMDKLDERVQIVGAHAAAMSALQSVGYNPYEPTTFSAGFGMYRNEQSVAVGVFHYAKENVLLNAGVSLNSDSDVMGRFGVSFTLGRKSGKQASMYHDMMAVQAALKSEIKRNDDLSRGMERMKQNLEAEKERNSEMEHDMNEMREMMLEMKKKLSELEESK